MSDLAVSAATPAPRAVASAPKTAPLNPDRASLHVWISVLAAMIGAFMAILNIQITNASLLNIEGGIGTGVDNGSWISTSYLIGEIVVIPLTDYLSRVFSFRNIMIGHATLFALFSVACAFTHDLPSMIAMRGLQGFFGGVLIPMAFTLVFTKLPKGQQPIGLAMFALAVTFAPAIGPTIGGYLTENYGWQTIFFVNVVPTAVMVTTLYFTLERQPMQFGLLREGDWFGIATMAIGLSALQAVLEEGNKDDWFGSPFIVRLALIAAISLSLFVAIELIVEKPLIRLRLLAQRNFGFGTISAIFVGFALFGSVYLLPAYLGQVQRYNAEQIGTVLAWTGLPQLILIPLVPKLMQRFDARYIAFTGMMLFAWSSFMNTAMSLDYSGDQLWIPNIVRAIGQALMLAPLSAVTLGSVAPEDAPAASGISNMMRNLGGAIGTAVLATIVTKREQFHSNIIGQSVDLGREEVRNRIAQMTEYFMAHGMTDPTGARHQAIIALGNAVKRQALVMGFSDTFAVLGVVLVAAGIAILLTGKPRPARRRAARTREHMRQRKGTAKHPLERARLLPPVMAKGRPMRTQERFQRRP
jgi:MFS transporter, DHA2 family, multidrug resistance protein